MYIMRQGRGSGYRRNRLWNFIIIILFLVCVAFGIWYFMSENFVFSADGIHFPWEKDNTTENTETTQATTKDIIIHTESTEVTTEGTTSTTPISKPKLNALYIPIENMADENYINSLISQGVSQIVFPVKDIDGKVNIPFPTTLVETSEILSPNAQIIANNIKKLKDNNVYIIGEISVLRDSIMPRNFKSEALSTEGGYTWLDRDNIPWFSPTSTTAEKYISDLISALKELKIDGVKLNNLSYPTFGKLDLILKNPPFDSKNITTLAKKIEALGLDTIITFYPVHTQEVSGQNIADLGNFRIAVNTQPNSELALSLEAQMPKENILYLLDSKNQGSDDINYIYYKQN